MRDDITVQRHPSLAGCIHKMIPVSAVMLSYIDGLVQDCSISSAITLESHELSHQYVVLCVKLSSCCDTDL